MVSDTGATVLLVNHSTDAQQRAKALVAQKGYMAYTATNAFEALFQLGAAPIDAIVCEADLPGRDSRWLRDRVTQLHPSTVFIVSPSGAGAEWERALEGLRPRQASAPVMAELETVASVSPMAPAISLVSVPEPHSAPETDADRRRAPRYRPECQLPVVLRGRSGLLRDLSVGGALIETDMHLGPERRFEIRFGNPAGTLRAAVEVVRCHVVGVHLNGVTYRVGVAFKSPLSESDVKRLVDGRAP
jgi:CheY-like chemotaxis protein